MHGLDPTRSGYLPSLCAQPILPILLLILPTLNELSATSDELRRVWPPYGADTGVADKPFFEVSFGHILREA